ncbi:MAG: DivIVA domain-containing protein [Christensenellales bacterium]|nr:DivIVA domain-containing protein [Christensenellales bacterium]
MAITLDTIVNKVFKVVKNGYDNNEVEAFLDEILEEMENREAETEKLKEQVETLKAELEQAKAQLAARPAVQAAPVAQAAAPERHSESFELVLSKAKGAYEEIVAAADVRAEEIVSKANQDAASIRTDAENQIADLTAKLASLRKQTADYYASVKRAMDAQNASMDQIKKLL